jgi:biotin synthase
MLSRVSWPAYKTKEVLNGIINAAGDGKIRRVCIQALNYPQVFTDLHAIVRAISRSVKVPISVSCQPVNLENMRQLENAGADRIGIALDAATKEVFDRTKGVDVKGPYNWKKQWQLLESAKEVFGEGNVSTHLIVGLGETDEEMAKAIQKCVDMAILPALFAFTPISGTALQNETRPQIRKYRRIQTARHLILHKIARFENMSFDETGSIIDFGVSQKALAKIIETGEPFLTSGCPDCNRPFYNEKPSGPIYNFPRTLTPKELSTAKEQLSPDRG